jgi:hypothetical protein
MPAISEGMLVLLSDLQISIALSCSISVVNTCSSIIVQYLDFLQHIVGPW